MKYLVLILSGALDGAPDAAGKSPLLAAAPQCLNQLAERARCGSARVTSAATPPRTDQRLMSQLGIGPTDANAGPAAIFAAGLGVGLTPPEQALLLDFVTVRDGRLVDEHAGFVRASERRPLIDRIRALLPAEFTLHEGPDQTQLLIWRTTGSLSRQATLAPELALGQPIRNLSPRGTGARTLATLVQTISMAIAADDVNQVRVDLGENPANAACIWGAGPLPRVTPFKQRFGVRGALISQAPVARGLARVLGWFAVAPPTTEHDVSAACDAHAAAALEMLEKTDLVCVHLDVATAAGVPLSFERQSTSLQLADQRLLLPLLEGVRRDADWRAVVILDRSAAACVADPAAPQAIFALAGGDIASNRRQTFDEAGCMTGELGQIPAWDLLEYFIRK